MADWITRYRAVLFVLLVAAVLAGVVLLQTRRPEPARGILDSLTPVGDSLTPASRSVPALEATPRLLRVYVTGAVQKPGVYRLPIDSIVEDAVMAAGGASEDADLVRVNLAHPLADGLQVHVPRVGESDAPVPLLSEPAETGPININTAGEAALESLPGIGPALAQRIVAYRQANGPFQNVDGLLEVEGIGPGTLEEIRGLITTE